jgi:hypothetical protein
MSLFARLLVLVAAVAAATAAVAEHRGWVDDRDAAIAAARRHGLLETDPLVEPRLRWAADGVSARRALARALLGRELVPRQDFDEAAARATLAHLDAARELAAVALADRPAAWDAAMVLGGTRYLDRSLRRDSRLITEAAAWERPLEAAAALAPSHTEPDGLRSAAYLELWFALSPAKREVARGLLARGFADPPSFERLIEPWLLVADSRDAAFELVPDRPRAWRTLTSIYERRGDWEGYGEAWRHGDEALGRDLERRLDRAAARLSGDPRGARTGFLEVVAAARPDLAFAPIVDRALALCPPGVVPRGYAPAFAAWLEWALEDDLYRRDGEPPLTPEAIGRLAAGAGNLPPPVVAHAALAAGDLGAAERLERRSGALWSELWTPYLLAKARRRLAKGDVAGAAAALDRVHRDWRRSPVFLLESRAVAGAAGDAAEAETADAEVARLDTGRWPATAWRWRRGAAGLDLLAASPARAVEVTLAEAPPSGAAVGVRWDGARVAVSPTGGGPLTTGPGEPGLHRLEVESLAGGRVAPGAVRLVR